MGGKEHSRKLTEKEQQRLERLDRITEELGGKGYERQDRTISITFANVMAFVWALPFAALFLVWFRARNGFLFRTTIPGLLAFLLLMFALTVVHEMVHGLTWGLFAPGGFRSIDFGFIRELLTPYCVCVDPLKKWQYLLGSVMPCLILGILPCIAAVLGGSVLWLALGLVMIIGAGGDLTIFARMLFDRACRGDAVIMDHPSEAGYVVFARNSAPAETNMKEDR